LPLHQATRILSAYINSFAGTLHHCLRGKRHNRISRVKKTLTLILLLVHAVKRGTSKKEIFLYSLFSGQQKTLLQFSLQLQHAFAHINNIWKFVFEFPDQEALISAL
jgi:hypothetical protein